MVVHIFQKCNGDVMVDVTNQNLPQDWESPIRGRRPKIHDIYRWQREFGRWLGTSIERQQGFHWKV